MGIFVKGTMQPVGFTAEETAEMIERGWQAMREGKIKPASSFKDNQMPKHTKRKPRKK